MAKSRKPTDSRREPEGHTRRPDENERKTEVDRPGKKKINRDEDQRRQEHQRNAETQP